MKAVAMGGHGDWTWWEAAMERRLTQSDLWVMDEGKFGFLLRAVADLLSSPSNLRIWSKTEEAACQLCKHLSCTLNHILGACPKGRWQI